MRSLYGYVLTIATLLFTCAAEVRSQSFMSRTYTEDDGLPSSNVRDVAQDARGVMWFATRLGVTSYDGLTWEPHNEPGRLPSRDICRIRVDARGRIWFLARTGAPWLACRNGDAFVAVPDPTTVLPNSTYRLSLAVLDTAAGTTVAVGTASKGLFLWSGEEWRQLTEQDGLPGNQVRALVADGKRLWIGTSGGLAVYADGAVDRSPRDLVRSPSPGIEAITLGPLVARAAGTATRLWLVGADWLGVLDGAEFTLAASKLAMSRDAGSPGAALWDGVRTLFFGALNRTFAFDVVSGEVRPFGREEGLIADGATSLFQDRELSLWVAGSRGVSKIPSQRFANYRTNQGLLDDEVTAICEPHPGVLLFGHNRGITRLEAGRFTATAFAGAAQAPARDPRVLEMTRSPDGSAWLASSDRGLGQILPDGELRWHSERLGVTDPVNSVVLGPRGDLLVATDRELLRFELQTLRIRSVEFTAGATRIRRIVPGPGSEPALATITQGLLSRHSGSWGPVPSQGPPETSSVYCSLRDSRGTFWVGTGAGLMRLTGDVLILSPAPSVLRPVYFLVEDRKGAVWVGTDRGVVRWDGERAAEFSIRQGLAGPETNRAAGFVDSRGTVWIGTSRGLSRFQPDYDAIRVPPPLVEILPPVAVQQEVSPSGEVRLPNSHDDLTFRFRVLSFIDEGAIQIRSRLEGFDDDWSAARPAGAREVRYTNLPPGRYHFLLRACSAAGAWSETAVSPLITVLPPFWRTWWFAVLAALAVAGVLVTTHQYLSQRRYTAELAAEVRRHTEQLRASEEERHRASKLESIGLLAGGIAHDFNNILAAITGFISAAKLRVGSDEPVYRTLEAAETAAVRATRLTKQLLTFAKGGAPVKRVTALGPLVREATGFALVGSNVRSVLSLPEDLWAAEVDEGQLSQVVHNLVLNAAQAMPGGGEIEITARNLHREAAAGGADHLPAGRYVQIAVADHGAGIPVEHLDKVFDPYFTTKPSGSGLGLATSYSIVRAHQGDLTVASTPGAGATFTVLVPAADQATTGEASEASDALGGSGRVLIMDDEAQVRDAYREVLTLLGYEVVLARDGREAIERYAVALSDDRPFAAVVLDLTVPGGMGGRETVVELLRLDPDVRAIVASGYVDDSVLAAPGAAGFRGILTKPFTIDDLDRTLRSVMNPARTTGRER